MARADNVSKRVENGNAGFTKDCNYSLIKVEQSPEGSTIESTCYSMHNVVHSWTVRVLNKEWNSQMAGIALDCVASHVPARETPNSWKIQRRLMSHAIRCLSFVDKGAISINGRSGALHCLGYLFAQQGKYDDSEKMYQQAIRGKEKELGPEHSSTLDTLDELVILYGDMGRWREAGMLGLRALKSRKRMLSQEHPSTLTSTANLASIFRNQGRWKDAARLEEQALEARTRILGEEHPATLTSRSNLASTYQRQGRLKDAARLEEQALEARTRMLGEEHPDGLKS